MDSSYNIPASIYWIGDIRHVMSNDIFNNVWKQNNYDEGVYNVNNYKFVVVPTVCGDDYYEDSEGFIYQVISGHFGLIDMNLCKNLSITQLSKGKIYNFDDSVNINMCNGIIKISSYNYELNIDTNEDDDENDDYLNDDYEFTDNIIKDPDYIPDDDTPSEYSEDFTDDDDDNDDDILIL